jgi:uncharacterized protein YceK
MTSLTKRWSGGRSPDGLRKWPRLALIPLVPILLLALVLYSGCGTIFTHTVARDERETGVYQGVRFDWECGTGGDQLAGPLLILDLPLSLGADTLVLPYDIIYSARNKEEPAGANSTP